MNVPMSSTNEDNAERSVTEIPFHEQEVLSEMLTPRSPGELDAEFTDSNKENAKGSGTPVRRNTINSLKYTEKSKFDKFTGKGEVFTARTGHGVASCGKKVYLFGGEISAKDGKGDSQTLNDFFEFDCEHNEWKCLLPNSTAPTADRPERRKGHSLVSIGDDRVLLFGGMAALGQATNRRPTRLRVTKEMEVESDVQVGSDLIYYNDAWIYHTKLGIWEELQPSGEKPYSRTQHSAVVYRNKFVLIFGGYGCFEDADVWVLDMERCQWDRMQLSATSERPSRRFGHVAAIYEDSMFVFGGRAKRKECSNEVWKYSLDSCSWARIEPTSHSPSGRSLPAAVQVEHRWVLHGGSSNSQTAASIRGSGFFEFNFKTESWRSLMSCFNPVPQLEQHKAVRVKLNKCVCSILFIGGVTGGVNPTGVIGGWRIDLFSMLLGSTNWKFEDLSIPPMLREVLVDLLRRMSGAEEMAELAKNNMENLQKAAETAHMELERNKLVMVDNQNKYEALVKEYQQSQNDLLAARAENEDLNKMTGVLQARANSSKQEITSLKTALEDSERNLEQANDEKGHLIATIKNNEMEASRLQRRLVAERDKALALREEAESEADGLRSDMNELGNTLTMCRESESNLKSANERLMGRITEEELKNRDLESELMVQRNSLGTLKNENERIQEMVGGLQEQLKTLQENAEMSRKELKRQLGEMKFENEQLLCQTNESLALANERIAELEGDVRTRNELLEKNHNQYANSEEKWKTERGKLESVIAELKSSLHEAAEHSARENVKLMAEIGGLTEKMKVLEESVESEQRQRGVLENQLMIERQTNRDNELKYNELDLKYKDLGQSQQKVYLHFIDMFKSMNVLTTDMNLLVKDGMAKVSSAPTPPLLQPTTTADGLISERKKRSSFQSGSRTTRQTSAN